MSAVKETAAKVFRTVAKTTKSVVEGAVAIARAMRGGEDRERKEQRARRRRDASSRGAEGRDREEESGAPPSSGRSESSGAPSVEEPEIVEEPEPADESSGDQPELDDIWGVGEARAEALRELGFETVSDVAEASVEQLQEMSGVGETTAGKIKDSAGELRG